MHPRSFFHLLPLFVAAIVITCAVTPFQHVTVYSKADLYALPCGFPLSYVEVDQSNLDPPYPWPVRCNLSGTEYYLQYFILDVAFFLALLIAIIGAVAFARMKLQADASAFQSLALDTLAKASVLVGILLIGGVLLIAVLVARIAFLSQPSIAIEPVEMGHPIPRLEFSQ